MRRDSPNCMTAASMQSASSRCVGMALRVAAPVRDLEGDGDSSSCSSSDATPRAALLLAQPSQRAIHADAIEPGVEPRLATKPGQCLVRPASRYPAGGPRPGQRCQPCAGSPRTASGRSAAPGCGTRCRQQLGSGPPARRRSRSSGSLSGGQVGLVSTPAEGFLSPVPCGSSILPGGRRSTPDRSGLLLQWREQGARTMVMAPCPPPLLVVVVDDHILATASESLDHHDGLGHALLGGGQGIGDGGGDGNAPAGGVARAATRDHLADGSRPPG